MRLLGTQMWGPTTTRDECTCLCTLLDERDVLRCMQRRQWRGSHRMSSVR